MAAPQWELNLFSADPRLLRPQDDRRYELGAAAIAGLASSTRLRLLHALAVGERTVQRAASWARVPQARAEAELHDLIRRGLLVRETHDGEPEYAPRDGHLVVLVYVALAHGGEPPCEPQPLLLRRKRRVASARVRAGE